MADKKKNHLEIIEAFKVTSVATNKRFSIHDAAIDFSCKGPFCGATACLSLVTLPDFRSAELSSCSDGGKPKSVGIRSIHTYIKIENLTQTRMT